MKKLFQKDISYKPRSFILTCLALFVASAVFGQRTIVLPNNSSYSNKTAPQGALRYQRGFFLITPAEMNASGLINGVNIDEIGFTIGRSASDTAHGRYKVYLQNTTDLVSRADTTWQTFPATGNQYNLNVLFPGDYEWQVKANCTSSSAFTPSVFFSNGNLSGCNNPYNLGTTSISSSGATLVWEAATSPGFVNYQVEYTKADTINWISATTTDTFYTVTGLDPGRLYQWKVRTVCSSSSSSVNLASFTTNTVNNCNPPTGLNYVVREDTIVKLTWNIPVDALYFQVQFRRAGTESWSATTSITDSAVLDLPLGTTFEWRVRTVCGTDSTGDFVNGTNFSTGGTAVCYEPTNTTTRQISPTFAELSWTAVQGATDYTVRYRLKNTISWTNATTPMQLVCDSNIIVPDTTGAFDIPFHGGTLPFTYTGGGLYVAWEFARPNGALTAPSVILSTTKGTSLKGSQGQDSIRYLLCMITNADSSLASMPDILGESGERPETRLGSASLSDSASVVSVFALGMHAPKYQSPTPISALIENKASTSKNIDVTLTVKEKISGTVRYTDMQTVPVPGTDTVLVNFTGWSPTVFETDSIFISIPAIAGENVLSNNSKAYVQVVNNSFIAYDDGTPMVGSSGTNAAAGLLLSKHHIDGCGRVLSAKIYLTDSAQGHTYNAVIRDGAGAIIATSPAFTPGADDVNKYHNFYFSSPPSFLNQDFYIGLKQAAGGSFPVGVQWEDAETRHGAYYRANDDGTGLVDHPQQGRLMIIAEVVASGTEPFIDGNKILCTGGSNLLTAGSTDTRFANSVLSFSSQYENNNYSAAQVLGTANVYPDYALSPNSWLSATTDGQREYIELSFPNAAPINFVDIYETANPGAVDSVFVKNPGTSLFELVYSATAAAIADPVARKNQISFTLTAFNVSEIRIALNSPAVGGHNAIDAVSIGKKDLPGTFSSYLWSPGGETTATKSVSTPGWYVLTVTNASGCQLKDSIEIVATATTAPTINGPSSFCAGDSVVLTSSYATGNTWSTGATTQSITVLTGGSYSVTYNDGSGCGSLSSAPHLVTVNPLPTVSISGALTFCEGGSTTLDAGGGFSSYFWSTGATSQTILVSTPGTFVVLVTDGNGCKNTASVTTGYATLAPPTITGNLSFCPGSSTTLDAGAGYSSYLWSTGAITRTINVTTADQFEVTVTNTGGCLATNSVITSLYTAPSPLISGNDGFCNGGSVALTASAGFAGYLWSTGATTAMITVSTPGTYTVTVTDGNGCTGAIGKTVIEFASPAPNISGTLSFCAGTSTTLNAGPGYAGYLWNTGATTQTIIVSTVGTFSVTVTDANGCTGFASASTTNTGSLPASPGPITGPAISPCNSAAIYSIAAVPNTSHYVWTVPAGATITSGQGTVSISVSFGPTFQGGYIIVAASNACGQSATLTQRKMFVQALANIPGAITGQKSSICGPTTKNYSIAAVPMATSYTWTAPAGATVISGQGTTAVTVSFTAGFSNGNLCVTANTICGSSQPSCVLLTGIPPQPGSISGPAVVCKNQQNVFYSVTPVPGAVSYTWTVPQSALITAGAGTSTIVVKFGPNSGNITVKANSACGTSAVRSLAIAVTTCSNGPQGYYTMTEIRPVPEIISNYGGIGRAGNNVFEWTLGEPRVEQESKLTMLYTQGFHQPLISIRPSKSDTVNVRGIKVVAFPNPVSSILKVKIESVISDRSLQIELTDLYGRVLQRRSIRTGTSDMIEMQMGRYIGGSYYLVVRDIKGIIITTIKLEKLDYYLRF